MRLGKNQRQVLQFFVQNKSQESMCLHEIGFATKLTYPKIATAIRRLSARGYFDIEWGHDKCGHSPKPCTVRYHFRTVQS